MIAIGIDPGISGAVVALSGPHVCAAHVMPILNIGKRKANRILDIAGLVRLLRPYTDRGHVAVAIEAQQAMPKQGLSSTAKISRMYGQLEGACAGLGLAYTLVRPREWQGILKGTPGEGKDRAIAYAQARLPGLDLCPGRRRKPHDGLADAACLALWASRIHRGVDDA